MKTLSSTITQKETRTYITIGSVVRVCFLNGDVRTFTITNEARAVAPDKGVISDKSPLGAALLGKTARDTVEFAVGSQVSLVKVIEIATGNKIN